MGSMSIDLRWSISNVLPNLKLGGSWSRLLHGHVLEILRARLKMFYPHPGQEVIIPYKSPSLFFSFVLVDANQSV